jgi:NAD(P)H-dependent FMN reductase
MIQLVIPVFYGSFRRDRKGIRVARFAISRLERMGHQPVLVDAVEAGLPMLDRMYKEYPKGDAPATMERLAELYRRADAFVVVAGEYNQGVQPGLKNLLDHFLEEYFWRPSGIVSYSAGAFAGVRSATAWRTTLAELGMPAVSSTFPVPRIQQAFDEDGEPRDEFREILERNFRKFAADLAWWAEAAKAQRANGKTPY